MQVVSGSWIRWLVSRIRSGADKLGDGWERDQVQRTAKRYDDDGHGKYFEVCWVETSAACCYYYDGESAPPTNEHTDVE